MQTVDLKKALQTQRIQLGFTPFVPHAFVDQMDVVSVIHVILENPQHHDLAKYELVGDNISYNDIAALMSRIFSKEVTCEERGLKEYIEELKLAGKISSEFEENYITEVLTYRDRW